MRGPDEYQPNGVKPLPAARRANRLPLMQGRLMGLLVTSQGEDRQWNEQAD